MKRSSCLIYAVLSLSNLVYAGEAVKKHQPSAPAAVTGLPASTLSNINDISMWLRDDGWSARDPASGNAGFTFPRQTAQAIFQDGWIWGGNVNDGGSPVLRVGGQHYRIGTAAGRIISPGVAEDPNAPDVRIYRIRADYQSANLRLDAAEINRVSPSVVTLAMIASVRAQYQTDWLEWPAHQGAPFYDADSNGIYEPRIVNGVPVLFPDADEPGIADADQGIWFVANDLDSGLTNALYDSSPIGLEMQVTVWAYDTTLGDPWSNVILKRVRLIYKGTTTTPPNATITDMYLAQWSDPDIGNFGDDFAGCDTVLSLGYAYNFFPSDLQYAAFGLNPPAAGYDLVQGPIVPGAPTDTAIFNLRKFAGFKNLPMTAWFYFASGSPISDPPYSREGTVQWYNLLRGLIPISGAGFVYPGEAEPTKFWLDGDPVAGTGRIDGVVDPPGDRRMGLCSGPFTMALGDTQEVVTAVIAALGTSNLNSVTLLKTYSPIVQQDYNNLLQALTTVSVKEIGGALPLSYYLGQNYPNPFNPSTAIQFSVPRSGYVTIKVYTMLGEEVATLVSREVVAGRYETEWDASGFASGVYFYRLRAGDFVDTKKLLLLK